ncbi:MAG: hypothetical protein M1497_16160 [Nitrospirae bacterium]|nr:hypothetical protein [Nitrospirota bacterium]
MKEGRILDIAHISFLDMIKIMITTSGAASAKGALIRNALKTAESVSLTEYHTFNDYLKGIETATNPITMIEGKSTHHGEFVFGLKDCPFGPSIRNYMEVFEKLPDGFADFTAEFNKPSNVTDQYRVGEGAGVSPFCSVHQPMRSAFAEKIKISGRKIRIYQLGCKSGSGKKGFAEKWIKESRVLKSAVDAILNNHMCCYSLKLLD